MKNLNWLRHRLEAMSLSEIAWRIEQKVLQTWEYGHFCRPDRAVWEFDVSRKGNPDREDKDRSACLIPADGVDSSNVTFFSDMALPGGYSYSVFRKKWNAGYQTENVWPEDPFSGKLKIASREDIGDIRTNWELNRHLQFPCLAKNYYLSGDQKDFRELKDLFADWNAHNRFLHGAEWTSTMEIAIRLINWAVTDAFLQKAEKEKNLPVDEILCRQIRQGILVMSDYVLRHRSRGSSANNHRIIELAAIGIAGLYLADETKIALAIRELTAELTAQFGPDGMNREMALHYQAFAMEAYGLFGLMLCSSGRTLPESWGKVLEPASRFLCDCCGEYGETLDFGDNDEGRILDLSGDRKAYYPYVLQLMEMLFPTRFSRQRLCETVYWLTDGNMRQACEKKEIYHSPEIAWYPDGGYMILRSKDRRLLLGFDCGPLGFGPLAAHGHADALSLQVYMDGKSLLLDPGTGSYHVPVSVRRPMRSTENHNTVYIDGKEQAFMQGPFLWGKRYSLLETRIEKNEDKITVLSGIAYDGVEHRRSLEYDFMRRISVSDEITGAEGKAWQCWTVPEGLDLMGENIRIQAETNGTTDTVIHIPCSHAYNCLETAQSFRIALQNGKIRTVFTVKDATGLPDESSI